MQIKIEIDVRPEELRRFLGLPDVAGLQEEVIRFLRTKVGQASESFDASAFVKGNLKLLGRNATLRKILAAGRRGETLETVDAEPDVETPPPRPRKRAATKRPRKPKVAAASPETASSSAEPPPE